MTDQKNKTFKVLSPTAILGYGFPRESFARGMKEKPDLIAVDGGSADPGPHYLGSGKSFTNKEGVKRDLAIMIEAGLKARIPVVVLNLILNGVQRLSVRSRRSTIFRLKWDRCG